MGNDSLIFLCFYETNEYLKKKGNEVDLVKSLKRLINCSPAALPLSSLWFLVHS